jgi:hypothetical protein
LILVDSIKKLKMKKLLFFTFFLAIFLLFTNCRQRNRFAINVNENPVQVTINRFDKSLISLDTTNIVAGIENLHRQYPDFFPFFLSNMGINPADTLLTAELIKDFLTDTTFMSVNQEVLRQFADVRDIERSLSVAYTYIRHYFPEINLPNVYFFVSGFNLPIMMDDEFIAMGIDKYLGADFPLYLTITYRYMLASMNRENIAPDLVSALLFREFRIAREHNRLIDNMLHRGKIMFLLSVFMPDVKDEFLIGYTAEEIRWSRRFERQIWTRMIDQKDLFSTDRFLIRQYMHDAPFTGPISPDSPGRLGTWIGWQIVRSYMNRNQQVTLEELMRTTDFQRILEESGYRP